MNHSLALPMRVPIYVPLLLVVASVALLGFDITSIVGASQPSHSHTERHSDDDRTFVASVQVPLDPGHQIRTTGRPLQAVVHGHAGGHLVDDVVALALADHLRFIVIPAWEIQDLARNGTATILHESDDPMGPQTFLVRELPAPPPKNPPPKNGSTSTEATPQLLPTDTEHVDSGWHLATATRPTAPSVDTWHIVSSVALVWLLENDTADYPWLSNMLTLDGVEGSGDERPTIIAVDAAVMARDPWLRGAAAVLAVAAIVLAVLPRVRLLPETLPEGPAGASIELAATGRRFLSSLRSAYIALAAAVVLLGVPLILSLSLFADNAAAGEAFGEPREQPHVGWHGAMWNLLILTLLAGTAAATRPAVEAHLALRRWRRHERTPPVEGELAD